MTTATDPAPQSEESRLIRHRSECSRRAPVDRHRGSFGDVMLSCTECRRMAPVPVTVAPRLPAGVGYVCRDHQDQPVTWRGTGCPMCAAARRPHTPPSRYEEE